MKEEELDAMLDELVKDRTPEEILGESGHRKTWLSPDITRVRHHLALDNLEQGRFSGAVAPNQTNPLAGIDLKSRALEQGIPAKRDRQIFEGQKWHEARSIDLYAIPSPKLGNSLRKKVFWRKSGLRPGYPTHRTAAPGSLQGTGAGSGGRWATGTVWKPNSVPGHPEGTLITNIVISELLEKNPWDSE